MSSRDRSQIGELTEIRRELRELRHYVEEAELREEIKDWIDRSHEESDADTAREYLERELNALLADNPMYHAPDFERGSDAFPDKCQDCRHYGSACPVLRDDVEVRWRERKLDQAGNEEDARRIYQQQAIDVSCHVIPELLEEWDNRHADFIREGEELLSRVEESVRGLPEELETGVEPAIADGGGP